ncbi:hypothetical protein ACFFU1_17515 [Algibacter miyuki]|uniref:Uncharacterized protein n=1 Tax=Algibacter miyuki TaxID=1306933 RepID=A0ABV5H490_9FLAO|nr:hypothetical protein [Algibacter miyuki]MDN3665752.1 hypothetical protein [Algibacter miyuki]
MRTYLLISCTKKNENFISKVEWNEDEMGQKIIFESEFETIANSLLNVKLNKRLDEICKIWLKFNQEKYRGGTNCQNGIIEVPSDNWICKLDKKLCLLQAVIELNNKSDFYEKCHANEIEKNNIIKTIESKKYNGFHHLAGRYQCPKCQKDKKQEKFSFHYPWEFIPLIDLELKETDFEILKKETDKILSRDFAKDPIICSNCAIDLIKKHLPNESRFKIFEYIIDRKKLNL